MEQTEFCFFYKARHSQGQCPKPPQEFKLEALAMRECSSDGGHGICDTPEKAAAYWRTNIENHGWHDPEKEMFVVLFLNTRMGVKGHHVVSLGTLDSVNVHPREVFRCAIAIAARSIMLMHNLCGASHKLCYVLHRIMWSDVSHIAITKGNSPIIARDGFT